MKLSLDRRLLNLGKDDSELKESGFSIVSQSTPKSSALTKNSFPEPLSNELSPEEDLSLSDL